MTAPHSHLLIAAPARVLTTTEECQLFLLKSRQFKTKKKYIFQEQDERGGDLS